MNQKEIIPDSLGLSKFFFSFVNSKNKELLFSDCLLKYLDCIWFDLKSICYIEIAKRKCWFSLFEKVCLFYFIDFLAEKKIKT